MTAKKLLSLILACTFAFTMLTFTGCTKKDDTDIKPADSTSDETGSGNKSDSDAPSAPAENKVKTPEFVNPLTGLECPENMVKNRPVAIMINNIHQALPQEGIAKADIIYEILEEGGITRLMALYLDYASLGETGSIRSSRDYFIDLSDAHDAIYVHCGGSTYAKNVLAARKTNDIDGMFMGNFYRSKERAKTMATEHTLMITGEGIAKNIQTKGYRTTSEASSPLKFETEDKTITGNAASYIEIPFSLALKTKPYALSTLSYDQNTKTYLNGQYDEKHIDGLTGEQLAFKNVITLECEQHVIAGDALGCLAVNFTGSGKGLYATDGAVKEIVWKKASRTEQYTLYEKDGSTELKLNPGKSYIAIVPTGTTVTCK